MENPLSLYVSLIEYPQGGLEIQKVYFSYFDLLLFITFTYVKLL